MGKVIAFINQKGGVGKTTTALNVGAGLKSLGFNVLFIDADAQCNLTYVLAGKNEYASTREVLTKEIDIKGAIQHCKEGDLIRGSYNLSTMDLELEGEDKAIRLKNALKYIKDDYDFIIFDTPPTLGIITINVLSCSDDVIVPVNTDAFSLMGLGQLYRSITAVRQNANPLLNLAGIVITIDPSLSVIDEKMENAFEKVSEVANTKVFNTRIIMSENIRESLLARKSIFNYSPNSVQAKTYMQLINEISKFDKER